MAVWLRKFEKRLGLEERPRLRKFLVAIVGFTVLLVGVLMIVLPGPAVLIIPIGFAILASEFAWARRVWRRGRLFVGRIRRGRQVRIVTREPRKTS